VFKKTLRVDSMPNPRFSYAVFKLPVEMNLNILVCMRTECL